MEEERVVYELQDHVAVVTLNRPEKLNALDLPMLHAIDAVGSELAQQPEVRCVILQGAGRAFCAGLDVVSVMGSEELNTSAITQRTHGIANLFQRAAWVWRSLPVPVVAAAHGVVFGGGLQILLGADVKIVHPDTRLCIMEMKWGLIPDMAGTQLMRHAVRDDVIRELTYTAREFSGVDAVQYGFATHLDPTPLEAAKTLALEIAARSPSAVVKAKKLLNAAPYLDAAEGLLHESIEQQSLLGQHNQMEAIYANMQKRKPAFKDYREAPASEAES
ncbi:MAG: crotonase/enoyl-CoA hydratase family protein [Saprospiraceae bacterium]|nr:crotonase/enoyl-CoA hydratase family protein [Saprospiraceae bacterium]